MTQFLVRITYTKDFPGIGKLIREHRQASKKQLAQLAAEAGISVPHWNRIENEKVGELPLTTLRGIEKALNVDLGVRFEEIGEL
ncbi:helix-turn-helix domain-containing protein [Myxacorys almedinensis]|uniref:Helix-turn-helix domain-containing protein n=1 Tax=Myxacorys almedinensis A TaxID=2690445 RepID=A0A8J8CNE2_9CYAN|nr:helix-turn-helix transcriptional regulator [Myxacorys almedinensis]NDJ19475.1 helix-turn-helix domain-containing protein [Myxacorys almedinensis A]